MKVGWCGYEIIQHVSICFLNSGIIRRKIFEFIRIPTSTFLIITLLPFGINEYFHYMISAGIFQDVSYLFFLYVF